MMVARDMHFPLPGKRKMRASAPGKLVVSGAYAILRGAPAIVTAVNRRVHADSARVASFSAPEVTAGIEILGEFGPVGARPWYDASELRSEREKLGLGSSAAICVSSLALLRAAQRDMGPQDFGGKAFRDDVFALCRKAHLSAQGGGSGIDIAAAVYGGTFWARRNRAPELPPELGPVELPDGLHFEVWASSKSASTSDFVRRVLSAEGTHPTRFAALLDDQSQASILCLEAAQQNLADAFLEALRAQHVALSELGQLSSTPVVLPLIHALHQMLPLDSCFLPSGAGGGDISLYVGPGPSPGRFRSLAEDSNLRLIPLTLAAPGLTLEFSS
jgi:phosphomevalonate kinase